jgi:hypothetical protein
MIKKKLLLDKALHKQIYYHQNNLFLSNYKLLNNNRIKNFMKITMMYLEINQKDKICRIKIQVHISKE